MEVERFIGSYEIKALIGEGGMGAVYLAEHTLIGRKAAIKVLKKEYAADATLVARFVNEARATNAIGHPGIVEILDFGTLPGNVPYLVMESLRGMSLAARLRATQRLAVPLACAIATQTAAALAAAHEKGIVHCDLKPDNLFLVPETAIPIGERVKVLDFGIAKLRKNVAPDSVTTHPRALMGTPTYMSPEQCRGLRDEIDQRTDVYALGIILYEMLCGTPPFVGMAFGDTLMMHMSVPVPRPSALNADIPPALEQTILKALAKDPNGRFASMHELSEALGQPLARKPSTPEPEGKRLAEPITYTPPPTVRLAEGTPVSAAVPIGQPEGEVKDAATPLGPSQAREGAEGRRRATRFGRSRLVTIGAAVVLLGSMVLFARRASRNQDREASHHREATADARAIAPEWDRAPGAGDGGIVGPGEAAPLAEPAWQARQTGERAAGKNPSPPKTKNPRTTRDSRRLKGARSLKVDQW